MLPPAPPPSFAGHLLHQAYSHAAVRGGGGGGREGGREGGMEGGRERRREGRREGGREGGGGNVSRGTVGTVLVYV